MAIDAAATSFYNNERYNVDGKIMHREELLDYYIELISEFPIILIEDPFYEEDFESFRELTRKIGNRVEIVGDDIFVTNIKRLKSCRVFLFIKRAKLERLPPIYNYK